ncbi:alpha/beta hydrolase [Corynebacterium kozikiae]|uniref:alpha/beta hydrolase n=1 Tax=Corynebacterium kozikiae TaxID=2968469 RepID=UPI00211CC646|nr:alpha/beta hydrolase [Corynebacterium sp. 76QC2CO]MCQ9343196.1 alpha/beta hydrolase [Corynebacterium sp. 76QC2CO]
MNATRLRTETSRQFGMTIREHFLEVPWDHFSTPNTPNSNEPAAQSTFTLYARELVPKGGEDLPAVVYLQGGPGFPAPRPFGASGIIGAALQHYRVILLDQRGTGRSNRIDATNATAHFQHLHLLRQEHIVEDAEALRKALGLEKWSLLGQSFGGFCITSYLSRHPESVERAYLTGGLPALEASVDEVYRTTFAKLRKRNLDFYQQFPWAQERLREICHHLELSDERLASGERLSARRLRTLGIGLGRGEGFAHLAYLLEEPFHTVAGEKRLKGDFLSQVSAELSFAGGPLYAVIHESIYGGVAGQDVTGWAAQRIREEIPGFEEQLDPRTAEPFFFTGEHIFPWQFEEDPALKVFADAAEQLARREWEQSPYHAETLASAPVTAAAAVYLDDIFVPFEYSMQTAQTYLDLRPHVTNKFQHDGIRHDGAGIFSELHTLIEDH